MCAYFSHGLHPAPVIYDDGQALQYIHTSKLPTVWLANQFASVNTIFSHKWDSTTYSATSSCSPAMHSIIDIDIVCI